METAIAFRWLGVAGIELAVNGQTLVVDPFFTRPPLRRLWWGRVCPDRDLIAAKLRRCTFVLVTHAHWDHVLDVPEVARRTGARVCGSANTCDLLRVCGVPPAQIRQIRAGDRLTLGPYHLTVLPAQHGSIGVDRLLGGPLPPNLRPPLRIRDCRMDDCFSFLISAGGQRLLCAPGERPEDAAPADVLFVHTHRPEAYYEALLRVVQPALVVPYHWDDFFRPLSKPLRPFFKPTWRALPPLERMNPLRLGRRIAQIAPTARVLVPEPFHTYELSTLAAQQRPPTQTSRSAHRSDKEGIR